MHENLIIMPLAGLNEVVNDHLMTQATELFSEELIFLNIIHHQDAVYKTRQLGLTLPTFNRYDTTQLKMLHDKVVLHYILTGEIVSVKSASSDENSPQYKRPEAVLNFQLLDAIHQTVAWRCNIRFVAEPLTFDKDHTYNIRDEKDAVYRAYFKAMKRLTKNFELIPNRSNLNGQILKTNVRLKYPVVAARLV